MKKKKRVVVAGILCMVILLMGCNKEDKTVQLNIAYFANITHAQALVLKSQGTLEKELSDNCKVTWTAFNAGPAVTEAMYAGKIDIAYIGPIPAINAYVRSKGDLNVIAGASNGGAVLVSRKDFMISEIKDLSGSTVAIPQLGNTQHLTLLHLLSENGLNTTMNGGTVNVVAVKNADLKALMDYAEVDAALVPEPWGSLLENEIDAKIVLDSDELWNDGNYSTAVVIVSKDFKEAHNDIVNKFLKAHKEATMYINENLEEAKIIVNEQIQQVTTKSIDQDILNTSFSRITISDEIPVKSISEFAELSLQEGLIQELPDCNLIDSSFMERVN